MLEFIKRMIFSLWNPKKKPFRDKTGKIIDDLQRKRHSKKVQQQLEDGTLKRPGYHGMDVTYKKGEPSQCFTVVNKGKVTSRGLLE